MSEGDLLVGLRQAIGVTLEATALIAVFCHHWTLWPLDIAGNTCFVNVALQCLRHTPGLPLMLLPDLLNAPTPDSQPATPTSAAALSPQLAPIRLASLHQIWYRAAALAAADLQQQSSLWQLILPWWQRCRSTPDSSCTWDQEYMESDSKVMQC